MEHLAALKKRIERLSAHEAARKVYGAAEHQWQLAPPLLSPTNFDQGPALKAVFQGQPLPNVGPLTKVFASTRSAAPLLRDAALSCAAARHVADLDDDGRVAALGRLPQAQRAARRHVAQRGEQERDVRHAELSARPLQPPDAARLHEYDARGSRRGRRQDSVVTLLEDELAPGAARYRLSYRG